MLAQEIASIATFCNSSNPAELYFGEIPEGFVIPSMYFPMPVMNTNGETVNSFRNSYQMFVKVFDKDTETAVTRAIALANHMNSKRLRLPTYTETNNPTGKFIRLDDVSVKKIDDSVAQLLLKWHSNEPFDRITAELIENFYVEYTKK